MAEYISREAALAFQSETEPCICKSVTTGKLFSATKDADLVAYIEAIPAADVRPVVRGKWNEEQMGWSGGDTAWVCSVCGEPWVLNDGTPQENNMNFCPNCGADMREEHDD